jgi:hypothetical protein
MSIFNYVRNAVLLVTGLAATPAAYAQSTASFVVVHGIPGRDVAATLDPALPVDVLVGGKYCLLQGLTFGSIAGPFDVPAGSYSVAISLANPIAPCTNSPVITATATLTAGEFGSIVAALSTAGAPTAEIYPIDVTPVGAGKQRLITAHAADAPEVSVQAVSIGKPKETLKFKLSPGKENESTAATASAFSVTATPVGGKTKIGPVTVEAGGDQSVVLLYAVGNATSGSLTILSKVLPDVF